MKCADCGCEIGKDKGPPDGWQLDDGRTVCHGCAVTELLSVDAQIRQMKKDQFDRGQNKH
jgi:hypothetical protein